MEPPMADLQYLVFVGPGVFLIGWAIAAYRRHRAFALRVEPLRISSPAGASIAYRKGEFQCS